MCNFILALDKMKKPKGKWARVPVRIIALLEFEIIFEAIRGKRILVDLRIAMMVSQF